MSEAFTSKRSGDGCWPVTQILAKPTPSAAVARRRGGSIAGRGAHAPPANGVCDHPDDGAQRATCENPVLIQSAPGGNRTPDFMELPMGVHCGTAGDPPLLVHPGAARPLAPIGAEHGTGLCRLTPSILLTGSSRDDTTLDGELAHAGFLPSSASLGACDGWAEAECQTTATCPSSTSDGADEHQADAQAPPPIWARALHFSVSSTLSAASAGGGELDPHRS